jgi:hypothetical protein
MNGTSEFKINMTMSDASGNRIAASMEEALVFDSGSSATLIYDGETLVWKGIQDNALPSTPSEDGWIHISSVNEFAALLAAGGQKGAKYHICNDMDMSLLPISVTDSFKSEALFEDICIDGGIYPGDAVPVDYKTTASGSIRIHGLEFPSASALFASVRNFEASNIILEDLIVGSESDNEEGTGTLIGRAYGKVSLTNIKVKNSEVMAPRRIGGLIGAIFGGKVDLNDCDLTSVNVSTTYKKGVSGQAGGLVGYIGRISEKDRSEKLDVSISKCDLRDCKVTAYMQSEDLQ